MNVWTAPVYENTLIVHADAPTVASVVPKQNLHAVAPETPEYVTAAHGKQAADPAKVPVGLYVPEGHSVHVPFVFL